MTSVALHDIEFSPFQSGSLSRAIQRTQSVWIRERLATTSVSVDEKRRTTLCAIEAVRINACYEGWDGYGATAVYEDTVAQALAFFRSLPTSLPAPDIAASPDGEISFNWSNGPAHIVSVAVTAAGMINYAALAGSSRNFGSEVLSDELPKSVALAIQKVVGSTSSR
jgi:hypothetical protein